jgi:hypothetical protein
MSLPAAYGIAGKIVPGYSPVIYSVNLKNEKNEKTNHFCLPGNDRCC